MRILGLNAAKEKLEIVSGAAEPQFRNFAGGFFRKNAFELIQEYCTKQFFMLKLIIFDWDDVITLGSTDGYFKCYHDTLVELGVRLGPEEEHKRILAKWSMPHREELRELLKETPELLDSACTIYEKKLFGDTFVNELRVAEGTTALLQKLHTTYALCVATGMNPKLLKNVVMPKFIIPNVFSQIISTYDIADTDKHKPHPHMVEEILKAHAVQPEQALFIGDAKTDVIMAQRAHVTPVVVLTGHLTKSDAEKLNVKFIIKNITDLPAVLSELSGE